MLLTKSRTVHAHIRPTIFLLREKYFACFVSGIFLFSGDREKYYENIFSLRAKKKPWRRGVTFRKRSLSLSFVCYYFSLKTTRQNCETHWTTVFYNSDTSITTDPRHVNFEVNSIQRMAFTSAKGRIRIVCKLFGGKLIGINNSMALRVLHQD